VVTASADGTVTIAAPGVERPERVIHVGAEPMTAQFIPGGLLGIETYGGWAGIWDAHGRRFQIRAESWYISPAFTGDGRRAVAAEEEGTATLWNVATGDIVRTFGRRRGRRVGGRARASEQASGLRASRAREPPAQTASVACAMKEGSAPSSRSYYGFAVS
jgi:hypothetical protein